MSKDSKRLQEIEARKAEIRSLLQGTSEVDLNALKSELELLSIEKSNIEERKMLADSIQVNEINVRSIEPKEDTPEDEDVVGSKEYRSAWLKNLMGKELNEVEKRAMTTASNSAGAVVPTITMNKIIEKLKQAGVILPLVTTLNIPSNVKIPVEDTTYDVEWVAEGGSNDKSDKLTVCELGANELIKTIEITAHVEAMSVDAFESFLIAQLVKKAKIAVDYGIINGTGTNNLPKGIISEVEPIETASTSAYAYDDIMTILASLPSGYKQNARFVVSTNTLYNEIAKIKDDNKNPIFKAETDGRFEGRLCGYPVVTYDNLADGKVIFGDFDYYYFNFVKNFEIAKDTSVGFKTGKVCYRVLGIADGNVALTEAFVVMGKKQ